MDLLGFTFKSPSAFLCSLVVIYFLETLSLVDVGEELSFVVGMMLDHEFADSRGFVIVLLSSVNDFGFIDSVEYLSILHVGLLSGVHYISNVY